MKLMALVFATCLFWGLKNVHAEETIQITQADNEIISRELEKEAQSEEHDTKTRKFLLKISDAFKSAKDRVEVKIDKMKDDCADCSREQKTKGFLTKLGMSLGKGASWVSTKTGKPFMTAAAFVKGAAEKGDKNQDLVHLYTFLLNHQAEFDELYLQAGTPDEMLELMLMKIEDIMEKKSRLLLIDLLAHAGIKKEVPEDLSQFELSTEEFASLDQSKLDPAFINNHPEYQEIRPLVGDVTKEDVTDLVSSGYINKMISLENYEKTLPSIPEMVGAFIGQLYVPKIALGVVSKSLAGLYFTPVLVADLGAQVSALVCLDKKVQAKFKDDQELKVFCSYVTNKTGYEFMKGRAKGYVAGKKFHQRVSAKVKRFKERRAEKKKENQVPALH